MVSNAEIKAQIDEGIANGRLRVNRRGFLVAEPFPSVHISRRAKDILLRNGYNTLEQLKAVGPNTIIMLNGITDKDIDEIFKEEPHESSE